MAHRHLRTNPASETDLESASRLLLPLFAAKDLDALIDTTFEVVQAAVMCDFVSAFYVSAGNGLLKERDSLGRESGAAFMRRYVELTPAVPFALANRGVKLILTRTSLPRSATALRRSAFYREIMQPQGWRHAAALCFWGEPAGELPVFVAAANRAESRGDFSDQEIGKLERIHPFLDCAVNRLHDREGAKTVREGMAAMVRDETRGFAILDGNLLLVHANPAGRKLCAAWAEVPSRTDADASVAWRLPPAVAGACRELHAEWQALLRADPDAIDVRRRRQLHADVPGLEASITMVSPTRTGLAEPTFVVEFERRLHGVFVETPDRSVPLLKKMTAAERAVAMIVADGFSNQEIADRLGKTVDAVKFLLHRIYTKTGIPGRAALVAVLRSRPNR